MKILQAKIAGVAGVAPGLIDFSVRGAPQNLVALSGPSGCGKSRLLFTLVHAKERLAPYGAGYPDEVLVGRTGHAKVEITWHLSADEQSDMGLKQAEVTSEVLYPPERGLPPMNDPSLVELLERYSHAPSIGLIDYVPPDRTIPATFGASGDQEKEQKRKRLEKGSAKYASIARLAAEHIRDGGARADALRTLFSRLCPQLQIGDVGPGTQLELIQSNGDAIALSCASSSEWEAFSIAATMVLVGLHHSVVLYDTPELHLSEAEAARRLSVLGEAFPTTQFIVATKARAILEAADRVVELSSVDTTTSAVDASRADTDRPDGRAQRSHSQ